MRLFFAVLGLCVSIKSIAADEAFYWGYRYLIYKPKVESVDKRPLVVLLHGCKQKAEDILSSTDLELYAEKEKFFLLAPEQSRLANPDGCWNWFLSVNQSSLSVGSELYWLHSLVSDVANKENIDFNRIYLVGFSSGAAQVLNLAYTHPTFYSGVLAHSGLAFKISTDDPGVEKILTEKPKMDIKLLGQKAYQADTVSLHTNKLSRIVFFHGTKDERVWVDHTHASFDQARGFYDQMDDQSYNDTMEFNLFQRSYKPKQKYNYSISKAYQKGARVDKIIIDGLGHKWSGGFNGTYADSMGFSATNYLLRAFELNDDR